jgi:hypothetical protein
VAGGGFPDAEKFPQQVWELAAHLAGRLPADHPYKRVRLQPEVPTAPEVWLLGSSDYSGRSRRSSAWRSRSLISSTRAAARK